MAKKDPRAAAIERAVKEMMDSGVDVDLEADKRPGLKALSAKLGFDVKSAERDAAYKEVVKNQPVVQRSRGSADGRPAGVEPERLETVVQIAARCMRKRQSLEGDGKPSHLRLTSLCASPVTPEVRDWACAEAYRRSDSLDAAEIVAKSIWPERKAG